MKIISKINFLYYFMLFLFSNSYIKFKDIKYLKRVGNGLSNTFIFKDKYAIKIKNKIRENENKRIYNGSYDDKFFYDTEDKFKNEFKILEKLNKLDLAPKPLEYSKSYLVLEYIESNTLSDYLYKTDDYTIFDKLKNKIEELHQNNIFHGDLNLNNILITRNKDIKFIDFESSFREDLELEEKIALEYKIMLEKMERFYSDIYSEYRKIYD